MSHYSSRTVGVSDSWRMSPLVAVHSLCLVAALRNTTRICQASPAGPHASAIKRRSATMGQRRAKVRLHRTRNDFQFNTFPQRSDQDVAVNTARGSCQHLAGNALGAAEVEH